jgi:hypothetical protein
MGSPGTPLVIARNGGAMDAVVWWRLELQRE